jgi:transcriptional regulator of NAD metabolism
LLDFPKDEEKQKLSKEINKIIIDLCQDQYGNYVIQHILETRKGQKCEEIFKALENKVYEMSIHKYASNVIERCLHFGSKEEKDRLIDEVILKGDKMHNSLISLVKDKFGNYVVQKMIEYSDKDKKDEIVKKILSSEILRKKDGYTKHVLSYIENLGYPINNSIDSSDNIDSNSNSNNIIPDVNSVSKVNYMNNEMKTNFNEKINIQNSSQNDSSLFNDEDYEDNKIDNEYDNVNDNISGNFDNVNMNHFINNNLNVYNLDNNNFQKEYEKDGKNNSNKFIQQ